MPPRARMRTQKSRKYSSTPPRPKSTSVRAETHPIRQLRPVKPIDADDVTPPGVAEPVVVLMVGEGCGGGGRDPSGHWLAPDPSAGSVIAGSPIGQKGEHQHRSDPDDRSTDEQPEVHAGDEGVASGGGELAAPATRRSLRHGKRSTDRTEDHRADRSMGLQHGTRSGP